MPMRPVGSVASRDAGIEGASKVTTSNRAALEAAWNVARLPCYEIACETAIWSCSRGERTPSMIPVHLKESNGLAKLRSDFSYSMPFS